MNRTNDSELLAETLIELAHKVHSARARAEYEQESKYKVEQDLAQARKINEIFSKQVAELKKEIEEKKANHQSDNDALSGTIENLRKRLREQSEELEIRTKRQRAAEAVIDRHHLKREFNKTLKAYTNIKFVD